MDLPHPYARYRRHPQHLSGDARSLTWFADRSLDFVYSSHVLEDFEDTSAVLAEWVRVLKPGGRLILYLPDERLYRAYCEKKGRQPNEHHVHTDFSLEYLIGVVAALGCLRVVHSASPVEQYSFELVAEKVDQ
jgi:ubiquinone/menaquinone biosynthesis C-methylase UbiE